jgi:S-adenosylmethionine-diacylglycerol 3-amino-3-carboxypropyl transferase
MDQQEATWQYRRGTGSGDILLRRVHRKNLVYNTCWEDPRIDRQLLQLDHESRVMMITSGGCNALNYLLDNPAEILCVDVNPRQNALLELKLAMIKRGRYGDFYQMFGMGSHPDYQSLFRELLPLLSAEAAGFWKSRMDWFNERTTRRSFYFHGSCGSLVWTGRKLFDLVDPGYFRQLIKLSHASDLQEQAMIFDRIEKSMIHTIICRMMSTTLFLSFFGVSRRQIRMIRDESPDGLQAFVRDIFRHVGTKIPIQDNYFWRVYFRGSYPPDCLPDYLLKEHFDTLQNRIGRIGIHNTSVSEFLFRYPGSYTHFVLLDHQDWLSFHDSEGLGEEWRLILKNSRAGTRILLRSAGFSASFIPGFVHDRVTFHPELTRSLHPTDRPGTYGSLHLGIVNP